MTAIATLPQPVANFERIDQFVRETTIHDIPRDVIQASRLYMLDLVGVLAAGSKLDAGVIARNHAAKHWCAGPGCESARILFDDRAVSLPGAAFAMATQIDNLDAHDGWQASKGHAGAALFPALAAFAEASPTLSGPEALVTFVIGYEVGYRAAAALHSTVEDYHTSGAWNALACASMGARLRGLNATKHRHAVGIAEYHGPRSQMMREIANPTMLHDGTGFGAPVGVYACLVAEDGFEGAPAATIEFDDAFSAWDDLGSRWLTTEQYIKPYPICRWAHAPIDAALNLKRGHSLSADDIKAIDIHTFTESAALSCEVPTSTSQAQYSLGWAVAAALVRGGVGVDEVLEESFTDPDLVRVTGLTKAHIDPEIDPTFPKERIGRVVVETVDGRTLDSGITKATGGPDPQPTEEKVVAKFRAFAGAVMAETRVEETLELVLGLDSEGSDFKAILDSLAPAL